MKKAIKIIYIFAIIIVSCFSISFKTKADSARKIIQEEIGEYLNVEVWDFIYYYKINLITEAEINTDTTTKIFVMSSETNAVNGETIEPPMQLIKNVNEIEYDITINNVNYYWFSISKNLFLENTDIIYIIFNELHIQVNSASQNISANISISFKTYEQGYKNGYDKGYDEGTLANQPEIYQQGYEKGQLDLENALTPTNFMNKVMTSVNTFLNIQLLPNVTIGGIILIPLALNLVIIIIKILKKH